VTEYCLLIFYFFHINKNAAQGYNVWQWVFFFQEFYLAKSGYKPNMKYKFLKLVSYIHGYTLKTKYENLEIFTFVFLTFGYWN